MRIVRPDGVVSAPIAGMRAGCQSVAAQDYDDVLLDPDFAKNRLLYITYFAPPRGGGFALPNEFFYEQVWTKSLAERRTMSLGMERVARARLSDDNRRLEDFRVLIDGGGERRSCSRATARCWSRSRPLRFYEPDLDGVEHDFTENPDIRRNFSGRVIRTNRDGSIPKDNWWLNRTTVLPETYAHAVAIRKGAAINPATGELWATDHGPQGGDAEINIIRAGRDYGWPDVSYGT